MKVLCFYVSLSDVCSAVLREVRARILNTGLRTDLGNFSKLFNLDPNLAAYTTAMVLGLEESCFRAKGFQLLSW